MNRILIRRQAALGDVLCTTPVIRRFAEAGWEVHVQTGTPSALERNPHVASTFSADPPNIAYDRGANLDLAYENRPSMHIVDAYFEMAFGEQAGDKSIIFDHDAPNPKIGRYGYVTIHGAHSWTNRTMPPDFWNAVVDGIVGRLHRRVVMVGGTGDFVRENGNDVQSAVGKLSLRDTASLIARASCHIGSDSSLLHLAGATEVPIVGIYTSVRGKYRAPYRHNELAWNTVVLDANIECAGCLEQASIPTTNLACRRGDDACVRAISAEDVIEAVARFVS
jgi:ADP-heptose:LPS heptosyltransferase